jgi:hypothetical protein
MVRSKVQDHAKGCIYYYMYNISNEAKSTTILLECDRNATANALHIKLALALTRDVSRQMLV